VVHAIKVNVMTRADFTAANTCLVSRVAQVASEVGEVNVRYLHLACSLVLCMTYVSAVLLNEYSSLRLTDIHIPEGHVLDNAVAASS
jgi:hypothetical protein